MTLARRCSQLIRGRHAAPLRFLLVGIANTFVGLGVIFSLKAFVGLGDVAANALGYAAGLVNSFAFNRAFTFRFKGATNAAVLRFVLVALLGYALNLWAVMASIALLEVDPYVGQALGIVPYTVFTYYGFKYFAFAPVAADARARRHP